MGVIRGPVKKLAGATRRALWTGTGTGLVLVAIAGGDPRHLQAVDNIGTLLFLGCSAVLLARWVKRLAAGRPVRDDILTQRVARVEARADHQERRVAAILGNVTETAAAAGVPTADGTETAPIPRLKLVRESRRDAAQLCGDVLAVPVPPLLLLALDTA